MLRHNDRCVQLGKFGEVRPKFDALVGCMRDRRGPSLSANFVLVLPLPCPNVTRGWGRLLGRGVLLYLAPPSEGKAEGGLTTKPWRETSGAFGKQLSAQRTELVQRLVTLKGGDEKLLGVKGVHLGRARAANAHLKGAPSLPAFERYTGVVWDHLDLSTLTAPQRTRALRSIVVISGLLGAVRADD